MDRRALNIASPRFNKGKRLLDDADWCVGVWKRGKFVHLLVVELVAANAASAKRRANQKRACPRNKNFQERKRIAAGGVARAQTCGELAKFGLYKKILEKYILKQATINRPIAIHASNTHDQQQPEKGTQKKKKKKKKQNCVVSTPLSGTKCNTKSAPLRVRSSLASTRVLMQRHCNVERHSCSPASWPHACEEATHSGADSV